MNTGKPSIGSIQKPRWAAEYLRFMLSGAVVVGLNLLIYYVLIRFLNVQYVIANTFAFLLCGVLDYWLNKKWVFKTVIKSDVLSGSKFLLINLLMLGLSNVSLALVVESGILNHLDWLRREEDKYIAAKILSVVIVSLVDFASKKTIVFSEKR